MCAAGLLMLAQQQRHQAEQATLQLTRALSLAIDAELQRAQSVLEALAGSAHLQENDLLPFHVQARQLVQQQGGWLQALLLADTQGQPVLNSHYPLGAVLPLPLEPASLQEVLQGSGAKVGSLVRGQRGQLGVPVRVPVLDPQGRVRYVLTGVMSPSAIAQVVRRQQTPSDWVVTVFDAKGLRVARSRGSDRLIGTPPGEELARVLAGGEQGVGTATSPEGDLLHVAFTRSPRTGWLVAAGMPPSAVYAGTGQLMMAFGVGLLLSLMLGLAAAVAMSRGVSKPLRALRQAAQDLGAGRVPGAPSHSLPELREVFQTLQRAGEERQRSDSERARLMSEAQSARLQAEEANRSKDEFLAMLGHELRNPLAPISTALRLMALRQPDTLTHERRVLERQVAHLTRLVDDLLDVSRFARGKVQIRREPLDLCEVVTRSVEMVQPVLDQRPAPVKVELPSTPVYVSGDAVRLAQVFSNLLTNAAKFTPFEGRITLRVRALDRAAEVSVEDSGNGIAPDLLPRVFDLFVQGRQSSDRQVGGLGLGLAIVKTLVELHGGSVRAESEGEGRGSRFVVTLPTLTQASLSTAMPAAARLPSSGRRILAVDDNVDAVETLAQVLRGLGHVVQTAHHAAHALALVEQACPDIAVLDIGLPGMDGLELARRLRADARCKGLRLVALTGYGHESDRERALASGFDEHLVKPVDVDQLQATIERLCEAAASRPRTADRASQA